MQILSDSLLQYISNHNQFDIEDLPLEMDIWFPMAYSHLLFLKISQTYIWTDSCCHATKADSVASFLKER